MHKAMPWLWAAVWFTLPVSMKANGASLILFGLAAVIFALMEKPVVQRPQIILAGLFILFFVWHGVSLILDPAPHDAWKLLERKLSLLAIPVMLLLVSGKMADPGKWAMRGLLAGLILTGAWLLGAALVKFIFGQPLESYTYHQFTKPFGFSAIYFSCFLSAAILTLAFRNAEEMVNRFKVPLLIFLVILLLLCASKLFIILTIPPLIWAIFRKYSPKKGALKYAVPLIALLLLAAGSVPFLNRISELKNTDIRIVVQDEYQYDTPLNGLTYRMILWRFAGEIMKDENAWLTGTGIGSRQDILNSYYIDHGIYTGNPELGDKGYLDYNFHCQYLETMVGTGIPGLILLCSIIVFAIFTGRHTLLFPGSVYVIMILFLVTESVLERQAGIVFFCLIMTARVHDRQNIN